MFYSEVVLSGESIINCGMAVVIMLTACYRAPYPWCWSRFFFVYLPKFFIQRLKGPFGNWNSLDSFMIYEKFLFFASFQLVLDGFLCFCVLKLPVEEHQQCADLET